MQKIKFFLEKFKNFVPSDRVLKTAVIAAVKKQTKIELTLSAIKISGWQIYLTVKPVVRSEIFIKRERIMAELEQTLANYQFKKII